MPPSVGNHMRCPLSAQTLCTSRAHTCGHKRVVHRSTQTHAHKVLQRAHVHTHTNTHTHTLTQWHLTCACTDAHTAHTFTLAQAHAVTSEHACTGT
eukprot:15431104-Alexandrium_andersonii.AAC.1